MDSPHDSNVNPYPSTLQVCVMPMIVRHNDDVPCIIVMVHMYIPNASDMSEASGHNLSLTRLYYVSVLVVNQ